MTIIIHFFQTNKGVVLVALLYFILSLPLTLNYDALIDAFGADIGRLVVSAVVVIVMSRFYKWNRNQKILHTFLVTFLFGLLRSIDPSISIVILILVTVIIYFVAQNLLNFRNKKSVTTQ